MDHHVTNIIHYMAQSHVEMAKILEEKRHVAVHMAQLIQHIPDYPPFHTVDQIAKHSVALTENVAAYLGSLADLQEAIAENLTLVIGELQGNTPDEDE